MAIWQYRLILLPEDDLRSIYLVLPQTIPKEIAEDRAWWSARQPHPGFEAEIDAILPRMKSWSEEIRMWGVRDGNDAHVIYVDDSLTKVEGISFRIDARGISPDLIYQICSFARRLGCVFLTHRYEIVPPSETAVLKAIGSSIAKRFVDDPITTLQTMETTKIEVSRHLFEED